MVRSAPPGLPNVRRCRNERWAVRVGGRIVFLKAATALGIVSVPVAATVILPYKYSERVKLMATAVSEPVEATTLPDSAQSLPGKGFTVTGIAPGPDGTWWASNDGRTRMGDINRPSLVRLSASFDRILDEITLPWRSSVQGVTMADGDVYFSLLNERAIGKLNNGRPEIAYRVAYQPNGLSFDPTSNALIVSEYKSRRLRFYDLHTRHLVRQIDTLAEPDQLGVGNGALFYSSGDNGKLGTIFQLSLSTGRIENRWKMGQALAIEGVAISGDNIIISDDSYFHQTRRPTNSIQRYAMGH